MLSFVIMTIMTSKSSRRTLATFLLVQKVTAIPKVLQEVILIEPLALTSRPQFIKCQILEKKPSLPSPLPQFTNPHTLELQYWLHSLHSPSLELLNRQSSLPSPHPRCLTALSLKTNGINHILNTGVVAAIPEPEHEAGLLEPPAPPLRYSMDISAKARTLYSKAFSQSSRTTGRYVCAPVGVILCVRLCDFVCVPVGMSLESC